MSDTTDTGHDWVDLLGRARREFDRRLTSVVDWTGPTPDQDWNTTQLVTHVIEELQWTPLLLKGRSYAQAQLAKRPLDADLTAEWRRHAAAAAAALTEFDPAAPIRLSAETVTADLYLHELVADVTIHSWDLARATGADETLDPELVAAVWTVFEPQKDTLVASGLYAAPVPLDDDAPLQSRLLALTGRQP